VVVFNCPFGVDIAAIAVLVPHDREQIFGATDKMNGPGGLGGLLLSLGTLSLSLHSVFLQEKLIAKAQIHVIANLSPSTKSMTCDADEKHSILASAPWAAVVSQLGGLWKTEGLEIRQRACDLADESHVRWSVDDGPGIEALDTLMVKEDSLLFFLRQILAGLLDSLHLGQIFLDE
jgi:hypothetical protein